MRKYEYRRQFIAGNRFWGDKAYWNHICIHEGLKLSVHQDLNLNMAQKKGKKIFLLGYMIDPLHPGLDNAEIVDRLFENSSDFSNLLQNTYSLSGRWVLIFVEQERVYFFHDAFGMRQIYYACVNGELWCGSEPSILSNCVNLKPDINDGELNTFIHSQVFKKKENYWIGNKTRYGEILHLLPNHYLELQSGKIHRFWVNEEESYSLKEAARKAGDILKNSLISANKRFSLMLPVTAGWDSRVLLAASKSIKSDLYFFISTKNQLTEQDDDIKIPARLLSKLNLKFHVWDNLSQPDAEFLELLEKNVDLPRKLHKTLTFYEFYLHHQDKVNVNGRGAETARSFYPFDETPNAEFLARVTGYDKDPFVLREIKKWLKNARSFAKENKIALTELYYWEQRMGNWGGTDPAEQDVAIEEFCPFNNRKLMMILLSTKQKYRIEPEYRLHKEILFYLWNDVLQEPINPQPTRQYLTKLLKSKIPGSFKRGIKKKVGKYPYG